MSGCPDFIPKDVVNNLLVKPGSSHPQTSDCLCFHIDISVYIYCLCQSCSYYKGIRQMVPVSDQDMNTHLAEISRVSVCARVHACVWESVYVLQRAWHCSVTYITLSLFAQSHTDKLNTQVALHQLYQYASKYYDGVSFTPGLFRTAFSFKVGNKTQSGVLLWQNNQDTLSPAPFILSLLSHSSLPRMAVY